MLRVAAIRGAASSRRIMLPVRPGGNVRFARTSRGLPRPMNKKRKGLPMRFDPRARSRRRNSSSSPPEPRCTSSASAKASGVHGKFMTPQHVCPRCKLPAPTGIVVEGKTKNRDLATKDKGGLGKCLHDNCTRRIWAKRMCAVHYKEMCEHVTREPSTATTRGKHANGRQDVSSSCSLVAASRSEPTSPCPDGFIDVPDLHLCIKCNRPDCSALDGGDG